MRPPSGPSPLFFVSLLSASLVACAVAPAPGETRATPSTAAAVDDAAPALEPGGERLALPATTHFPAPHPSMPRIPRHGGVVLSEPRVVTVTFPGDALQDKLQAFGDQVGSLAWWGTVGQSYGFGPAQGGGHVAVAEAPPQALTNAEVEQWLSSRLADGTLPAPTDQSVYVLYYPATTTVTITDDGSGAASCQAFLGYHTSVDVTVGGQTLSVAYAVVNRCGELDQVTETASHELAEVASDPHPTDEAHAGYIFLDNTAWTVLGGENADMCAGVSGVREAGWALTRVWSNDQAALGAQPCVPAPEGDVPYFNAGIVKDSVVLPPGGKAPIEVDCYSFGPLPSPIKLSAQANGGSGTRFAFSRPTCNNGDKVTMTITLPASAKRGTDDSYTLLARLDESSAHLWRGVVHVR